MLADVEVDSIDNYSELPSTVEEVRVLNVFNPFFIAVSNVKHYTEKTKEISRKLQLLVKDICRNTTGHAEIGTLAVIEGQVGKKVELPAWWCRGVINDFNDDTLEYDIFLPDYGTVVSLSRPHFMTIPGESLPDDFLTYPVCLYNILPGILRGYMGEERKKQYEMIVKSDWSPDAVNLTKQLIAASKKNYFDYIAQRDGKKYGELYLIVDEQIVPLRKALVHSNHAVYVNDKLCTKIVESQSQSIHSGSTDSVKNNTFIITDTPLVIPDDSSHLTSTGKSQEGPKTSTPSPKSKGRHYGEIFVSSTTECKRITSINDAMFAPSVHKALEAIDVKHLWKIPSYTWPAISKGLDVLVVGGRSTGKTIGYAAPIANIIIATKDQQEDNYPMVLVFCSSTDDVQHVHDMFHQLLAKYIDIKIVSAYNGVPFKSLIAKLYNGCHIFISTAAFLERFLGKEEHRKVLNLNYVRHIIFDRLDVIWSKQKNALIKIIRETPLGKRRFQNSKKFTVQIIAVADCWSTSLGKFIEIFSDPYICIGSYPDAVISCGIQPKLRQIPRAQKPAKMLEILKNHHRVVKTLIVCSTRREAAKLKDYLSEHYKILYVDKKSPIAEIHGIKECWDASISGQYPIFICTDEALHDLRISDAEWLIHYSIATVTKSIFYFRFSTLMANLKEEGKKLEVTIIIDECNDVQLQGIMNLMERSGVRLTDEQLQVADKIMMSLDRKKKDYPICNMVKAFGFCQKRNKCPYRHCILPDIDKSVIPVQHGDEIKLVLTYVHTATHFSGRILERRDKTGIVHKIPEEDHYGITSRIHSYYGIHKNRIISRQIEVGKLYGYKCAQDHFERVRVINIAKKGIDDRPLYVDLKCIDTGMGFNHIRVSGLLEMPEELAKTPAHIVEIFLVNVMPYDNEDTWSLPATDCSHQWLNDHRSPDKFLQAKVQLVLGNTVWVDRMDIKMKVVGRRDQYCTSLKDRLIRMHHGIPDDGHMKRLFKLCRIGGIRHPD